MRKENSQVVIMIFKIYERQYNNQKSYRFQLCLASPRISDIFIADFQCNMDSRMNRVLIETIGLEDRNIQTSNSSSVIFTSSVVLSIFENSFPHYVEFTLMEPSTKAEWSHKISSNALSSLVLKEKFVKVVYYNVKEGPFRGWNSSDKIKIPTLLYENLHAMEFEKNLENNILDIEAKQLEEVKNFNFKNSKEILAKPKPKIYLFSGDFKSKIAINMENKEDEKQLDFEQYDDRINKNNPTRL